MRSNMRCHLGIVLGVTLFTADLLPAQDKAALSNSITARDAACWETALAIWNLAEPGYQEEESSALLATMLEEAGFTVERGIAGIPTAFIAEFGTGQPVIGILGEFDALPGLSQQAVPYQEARDETTWGHGCGHHLFGVASASAAIAIAEQIAAGHLSGTIRFYGCPAEEGGSGKVFMVRDGFFADVDAVLHWHPSDTNAAGDRSSLARIAAKFRFHGRSAHAAGAPEQGRSALDAVELMNHAVQLLREHTPEESRIHHVITFGGEAPNVIPDLAEVYYYVRHPESTTVRELYERVLKCAQAGALATETELEVVYEGGIVEILPNNALAEITMRNLRELNDLTYTESEVEFALRIQESMLNPEPLDNIQFVRDRSGTVGRGSTDVGDVSWVVPTTGFNTACWVPGTPGHSWQAVACGGTEIAHKGMHLAARVLAASAWDMFTSPETLVAAQEELARRLSGRAYEPLILPDQPPPLDYRIPVRTIGD